MGTSKKYDLSRKLDPREFKLLEFLWKWQVSTASLILRYGIPEFAPSFFDRRMHKFDNDFIKRKETVCQRLRGFTITPSGNKCVEEIIGDFNEVENQTYVFYFF